MIVVYDDVAGLSEIYLTDDESMVTMKKASQEQLACDTVTLSLRHFHPRVLFRKFVTWQVSALQFEML